MKGTSSARKGRRAFAMQINAPSGAKQCPYIRRALQTHGQDKYVDKGTIDVEETRRKKGVFVSSLLFPPALPRDTNANAEWIRSA